MAVYVLCPACQSGDHARHVEQWGTRPEGIIDGEFCNCKGGCQPPDFSRWLLPAPTPTGTFTPTDEDVERAAQGLPGAWGYDVTTMVARAALATIGPIIERERRAATEAEVDRFGAELAELRAENERLRRAAKAEALREFADDIWLMRYLGQMGPGSFRVARVVVKRTAEYARRLAVE